MTDSKAASPPVPAAGPALDASSTPGGQRPAAAPLTDDPADQVWVNTRSGVIWKPGTRFYGKTKEGKYMTEADALAAGYHDQGQHVQK